MDHILRISLRAARVNANLTQEASAAAFGVGVNSIIKWEKNPDQMPRAYALMIPEVYGISVDNILFTQTLN